MEKSLAFYRDILGMQVLADAMTDPTEGGRLHNYQQARKSRLRVSLSFGTGLKPTLTLTSHVGEEIAGAPLKLDQLGITHFSFTVPDPEALLHELLARVSRRVVRGSRSPTRRGGYAAFMCTTRMALSFSLTVGSGKAKAPALRREGVVASDLTSAATRSPARDTPWCAVRQ